MHILLVEDNEGDIELTGLAFRKAKSPTTLSVAHDGVEALEYLRRQGTHQEALRPDIILLDLNMPRMGGLQLLEIIKKDPTFLAIPVIVLTSSNAPKDIQDAYDRHANCYILKPFNFERFVAFALQIESYWGNWARLTERNGLPAMA